MFLSEQELQREAERRAGVTGVHLAAILKGGSDRRFFRLSNPQFHCILMEYGLEREENALYADIGRFLGRLGLEVPEILAHDEEKRLVWIEDLGAEDLWAFRGKPWSERAPLYRSALEQANRLHQQGYRAAQKANLKLMPGFDAALYAWERSYFYEKFLALLCQSPLSESEKESLEGLLAPLAGELLEEPEVLVHRDFQSQNIMVKAGWTYLIDFQGMRTGTAYYDLASLLFDPYVQLSTEEREECLTYYYCLPGKRPRRAHFDERFLQAATQRLMQALGAYGFLGLEKGKKSFLAHVEPALNSLCHITRARRDQRDFLRILERAQETLDRNQNIRAREQPGAQGKT
ncbi:MAG: phosphotransferase [Blastochloris sp.]|nr:phosphotransferase [Blastochloris sp.]